MSEKTFQIMTQFSSGKVYMWKRGLRKETRVPSAGIKSREPRVFNSQSQNPFSRNLYYKEIRRLVCIANQLVKLVSYIWAFWRKVFLSWRKAYPRNVENTFNLYTLWNHETMIKTEIKCKEISCYMRKSACRWRIVENPKLFWSYVKHFWIFPRIEYCLVYVNKFSWIAHWYFLTRQSSQISANLFLLLLKFL